MEAEEWVVDLGTTSRREKSYGRMLMVYWVMKKIISHVSMEWEAKRNEDEEPTHAWKDHNAYCILMHHKVDLIVAHLEI